MRSFDSIDLILGVDQTGAVRGRLREPAPLHACVLTREGPRSWRLETCEIPRLSPSEMRARLGGDSYARSVWVLDCVLGLPAGTRWRGNVTAGASRSDRLWALLSLTRREPDWGRAAAERFFAGFLPKEVSARREAARLPQRRCEILAGANSVFLTRPYQRNIQTGTFRLWKELSSEGLERCLNFGAFETARSAIECAPWVFEGYPSFFWRSRFGFARRESSSIRSVFEQLKRHSSQDVRVSRRELARLCKSPDLADAAILSLGALSLQASAPRRWARAPRFRALEGWILGLAGT